ncbi:MAG: hypothetical protein ACUVT2_05420 [Thiobacillaceae bacterium]
MPSFNQHTAEATQASASRQGLAWWLLTLWLAYSAAALGWHLAHDPLLSAYTICGRK